jgi:hypothetical protein
LVEEASLPKGGEGDEPNKNLVQTHLVFIYFRVLSSILHTSCAHLTLWLEKGFRRRTLLAEATLFLSVQVEELLGATLVLKYCSPRCQEEAVNCFETSQIDSSIHLRPSF